MALLPLGLKAALLGLATGSGVLVGAIVGLVLKPRRSVIAVVMAFGSGTLISALTFDLCLEALRRGGAVSMIVGFVTGGVLFVFVETAINSKGGFLRREGTRAVFLRKKRQERAKDILDRLSQTEIMSSLPASEVQALVPFVEETSFEDGAHVFDKGDEGDALYLLLDGEAKVLDGDELLTTLTKGAAFGEMALLTGEKSNAAVVASGALRTYRIKHEDFEHLMGQSPRLAEAVRELLAERIEHRSQIGTARSAEAWRKIATASLGSRMTSVEERQLARSHAGAAAPVAIFLGVVIDGIPESAVIGASAVIDGLPSLSFLLAVFLSNFPEAMSSASGLTRAGFSDRRILGMWGAFVAVATLSAFLGSSLLAGASPKALAFTESVAAGSILALLTNTMMPEAFEMGGRAVAFATMAGFLMSFLIATAM